MQSVLQNTGEVGGTHLSMQAPVSKVMASTWMVMVVRTREEVEEPVTEACCTLRMVDARSRSPSIMML